MSNIWEQPVLQLAKPQKDYYTVLTGVKSFKPKLYLNNICEASFRVYEYENNVRNELYDELEETQLIEAIDYEVEWFQIAKVDEKKDDVPVAYKDITCNSLEDELIAKTVYNLNGVYKLYNLEDTTKSIMHIITNDISWNIGYISSSLAGLYRTLSIDSGRIYSLLTSDLSKSFNCIFKFSREYKTISAYSLDEIGEETDIVISEDNLLKSWEKSSDKDKIVTRMRCIGGTSTDGQVFDIRKVNFGSDTICNYSYFKPRMSTALQTALTNYENAIITNSTAYNTNIALLKTYNTDLNTLNNAMTEIKSQISAQEQVMNVSLQVPSHIGYPPTPTDSDYTNYQNAVNQLVILNTQKANKQVEIDAKNAQIATVNATLDTISSNVDKSKFFTTALLEELDCFTYTGDDYQDDTFLANDETTSVQEIEMAQQLKANAEKELAIACRPQPEFKATLKNLWSLYDEKDCVISYDKWREKFKLGNIVTIILNDDSWTTVRIIGIELDYDDPENAEITFSSRTRLDNSTFNLGEIQAQASRAYSAVSMNKYSWNVAASQSSDNEAFRTDVLTATYNKMQSDPMGKVEFGDYGIKCRDWIESEKAYGLNGMWLNPYRMLFSKDGFKTAGAAFGLLSFPDGTQGMGINAKYFIGDIGLFQNLTISNESNTITMNKDGAIFKNCDITIQKGTNTLTLNATDGIKLINGTIQQFYLDANGDFTSAGKIVGGSININNKFIVDSDGVLNCTGAKVTGEILATKGTIAGFSFTDDSTTGSFTAGSGNKYIRISPISFLNSGNYDTTYGAIDLGLTTNGEESLIHLRSNGYARFGSSQYLGNIKFNYSSGGTQYTLYSSNFRIEAETGYVNTNYINSFTGEDLWITGTKGVLLGADGGDASIYGYNIKLSTNASGGKFTFDDAEVITSSNFQSQLNSSTVSYATNSGYASNSANSQYATNAGNATSSSSCATGLLTLSSGTLTADSGSLYIGQNTVKANTITELSSASLKKNINKYMDSVLTKVCSTVVKTYNYKNEEDTHKLHFGVMVEEAPEEIINPDGDGIDIYAMATMDWKAIQELYNIIEDLKSELSLLQNK